ncbi:MAG: hypothetical protein JSU95_18300 [Betaproteobacteria bacterium]|nr:MAG: hypothetical protein JSU95_18300 [Betaproteobacteria bacterium]
MNILMILFLPLVVHGTMSCPQHVTTSMEIQMVAANRHASIGNGSFGSDDGLIETGVRGTDKPERDLYSETAAPADSDLLFYFSSHAQAVGDTTGPTMTPWLELRPIGDVEQGVLSGTSEPAPVGSDPACSRTAAHVPARLSGEI